MEPIQKEYAVLFNAITDTERTLERLRQQLIFTQQLAEELYINRDNETGKGTLSAT